MSWVLFLQIVLLAILFTILIMTVVNTAIERIYLGKATLLYRPKSFFVNHKD